MAKPSQKLVLRGGGSGIETVSDRVQRSMVPASESVIGVRNECSDIASVADKVWRKIWGRVVRGMLTRRGLVRRRDLSALCLAPWY